MKFSNKQKTVKKPPLPKKSQPFKNERYSTIAYNSQLPSNPMYKTDNLWFARNTSIDIKKNYANKPSNQHIQERQERYSRIGNKLIDTNSQKDKTSQQRRKSSFYNQSEKSMPVNPINKYEFYYKKSAEPSEKEGRSSSMAEGVNVPPQLSKLISEKEDHTEINVYKKQKEFPTSRPSAYQFAILGNRASIRNTFDVGTTNPYTYKKHNDQHAFDTSGYFSSSPQHDSLNRRFSQSQEQTQRSINTRVNELSVASYNVQSMATKAQMDCSELRTKLKQTEQTLNSLRISKQILEDAREALFKQLNYKNKYIKEIETKLSEFTGNKATGKEEVFKKQLEQKQLKIAFLNQRVEHLTGATTHLSLQLKMSIQNSNSQLSEKLQLEISVLEGQIAKLIERQEGNNKIRLQEKQLHNTKIEQMKQQIQQQKSKQGNILVICANQQQAIKILDQNQKSLTRELENEREKTQLLKQQSQQKEQQLKEVKQNCKMISKKFEQMIRVREGLESQIIKLQQNLKNELTKQQSYEEQKTLFKTAIQDLIDTNNLYQKQIQILLQEKTLLQKKSEQNQFSKEKSISIQAYNQLQQEYNQVKGYALIAEQLMQREQTTLKIELQTQTQRQKLLAAAEEAIANVCFFFTEEVIQVQTTIQETISIYQQKLANLLQKMNVLKELKKNCSKSNFPVIQEEQSDRIMQLGKENRFLKEQLNEKISILMQITEEKAEIIKYFQAKITQKDTQTSHQGQKHRIIKRSSESNPRMFKRKPMHSRSVSDTSSAKDDPPRRQNSTTLLLENQQKTNSLPQGHRYEQPSIQEFLQQLDYKNYIIKEMTQSLQSYKEIVNALKEKLQSQNAQKMSESPLLRCYQQVLSLFNMEWYPSSQSQDPPQEELLQNINQFSRRVEDLIMSVSALEKQLTKVTQQNIKMKSDQEMVLKKCEFMITSAESENDELVARCKELLKKMENAEIFINNLVKTLQETNIDCMKNQAKGLQHKLQQQVFQSINKYQNIQNQEEYQHTQNQEEQENAQSEEQQIEKEEKVQIEIDQEQYEEIEEKVTLEIRKAASKKMQKDKNGQDLELDPQSYGDFSNFSSPLSPASQQKFSNSLTWHQKLGRRNNRNQKGTVSNQSTAEEKRVRGGKHINRF